MNTQEQKPKKFNDKNTKLQKLNLPIYKHNITKIKFVNI